jgi:phosphohistidine phosphatase SixA
MPSSIHRRAFFAGVGAFAIAAWPGLRPVEARAAISSDSLASLRSGNLVVYFRHAATTWSGVDQIDWPRERQRLLSEEGIRQSRMIGQEFKRLDLPVGDVLASPFARCRDMAEIAFGRVEERLELLGLLSDSAGREDRVAYLRQQVSTPTNGTGNRIIVSHTSNIREVANVFLNEGDGVLLRPLGDERFEILESVAPDQWSAV